jgi:hypothetical protein
VRTERVGGRGVEGSRPVVLGRELIWPVAIAVGLALVVLVNAVFVYIAVKGKEDVAPSYVHGER